MQFWHKFFQSIKILKLCSSWFLVKVDFTLPQTIKFYKSINLFYLVFVPNFWISICSFVLTTNTIGFHCFYIIYFKEVFISSFISSYSLNTLFSEINSSWLKYESIKALEIKNSIVFNISFPNNTRLPCFFFFFLIIDLHFLISVVSAQIFILTAKILIVTGTETDEANMKIKTQLKT